MRTINLYTDGGARGNPGPAATGVVVVGGKGEILYEGSKYLGTATNNQAEYQALIHGLESVCKLKIASIDLRAHLDSELIVKQMRGEYRVKNQGLKPLFEKAQKLAKTIGEVRFVHIVRENNKKADSLVNQELNSRV